MTLEDRLSFDDLEKIKNWIKKSQGWATCPHCGEKCIITV